MRKRHSRYSTVRQSRSYRGDERHEDVTELYSIFTRLGIFEKPDLFRAAYYTGDAVTITALNSSTGEPKQITKTEDNPKTYLVVGRRYINYDYDGLLQIAYNDEVSDPRNNRHVFNIKEPFSLERFWIMGVSTP